MAKRIRDFTFFCSETFLFKEKRSILNVDFSGPMVSKHKSVMDESKSTIMSTKTSTVIFNFQDVPEIDQIGLDFILSIISPLKEKQGTIRLCCATPALKSVLVSAGLVTETDLFPDLSTATHSISKLQVA